MSLIPFPTLSQACPVAMSLQPSAVTRAHAGAFGGDGAEAVVDLLQDRWMASLEMSPSQLQDAGAVEAWLAAQRGGANTTPLHHMGRPVPLGTLGRVYPVVGVVNDAPQGADAITLGTAVGATLLAGDLFRVGGDASGQGGLLLQCAADCVAGANGLITVPLVNRLRRALVGHRRASTATYIESNGTLQTAAINTLRLQNGARFVEAAATNLAVQSQNLAASPWSGDVAAVSSGAFWRGTVPFYTLSKTTVTTSEFRGQALGSVAAGQAYNFTLALLAGTADVVDLGLYSTPTPEGWGLEADAQAQIIEGPGVLSQIIGALYRVTGLSATVPTLLRVARLYTLSANGALYLYPASAVSTTVGGSVQATRVQVEAGGAHTSYIPTTTAPVTRAADVITAVEWNRPARPFRLATRTALRHVPGYAEGLALDFVEDLST